MAIKRNRTLKRAAAREARKLMRGGMAAGLVALGACGESHTPGLDTSMASGGSQASMSGGGVSGRDAPIKNDNDAGSFHGFAGAPEKPATETPRDAGIDTHTNGNASVNASADIVDPNTVGRNVLYSWTSSTQIMELRDSPVLLTRSEKSDGTQTQLSTVIAALAAGGDSLAQVLAMPKFQKGRYAWSNAWATVRGWPNESYGDQLLRIVLKPEAWIAILSGGYLRVVDLSNQEVLPSDALAHPERIAAVYFLNEGSDPNACGTFVSGCGTGAFREYFINNESMVLEWSFGTQAILDELQRSVELILALRGEVAAGPMHGDVCEFTREAYCTWNHWYELAPNSTRLEAYRHALALTSEYYMPIPENLDALITALKLAFFSPDPFEHKP